MTSRSAPTSCGNSNSNNNSEGGRSHWVEVVIGALFLVCAVAASIYDASKTLVLRAMVGEADALILPLGGNASVLFDRWKRNELAFWWVHSLSICLTAPLLLRSWSRASTSMRQSRPTGCLPFPRCRSAAPWLPTISWAAAAPTAPPSTRSPPDSLPATMPTARPARLFLLLLPFLRPVSKHVKTHFYFFHPKGKTKKGMLAVRTVALAVLCASTTAAAMIMTTTKGEQAWGRQRLVARCPHRRRQAKRLKSRRPQRSFCGRIA
ncbi:hypothetical protein pclt_cds_29 [Pandoravirus celtis]|uniref:Uncharacterized protein n=1 Tax=Pandoravirus celtis TaxID=2568002 RepID=A0A4D6EH80_9VIRU|nr:hypothetical protein pclt_cds_29 [Pandoravirus celtis]